ncbi:chemotaxis protein CheD [Aquimixticola soesokkakensis]|nr:chemotaxis protein CheD [Aquimixticola soesokkakensis]
MNHFLLPEGGGDATKGVSSYGANAMELLINALIRHGANRDRLRAKVFGGAQMYRGLTDAGTLNGRFVLDYLERENIPCEGKSLGGTHARRVEFVPYEGKARQKYVSDAPIRAVAAVVLPANEVELF